MTGPWTNSQSNPGGQGDPVVGRWSRDRAAVGERIEVTWEVAGRAGDELRFAEPPRIDPALALVERRLEPATASDPRARMTLSLVACDGGDVEIGPLELALRSVDGTARAFTTAPDRVRVTAPWTGKAGEEGQVEPPPFGPWRRVPEPEASAWLPIAVVVAALALALGWIALRRRMRARPATVTAPIESGRPSREEWRDLFDRVPSSRTEPVRRAWCGQAHALVRRELGARSAAANYFWSRQEIVAGGGLGAWPTADQPSWSGVLAEIERGMFSRRGIDDVAQVIATPLRRLVSADGVAP